MVADRVAILGAGSVGCFIGGAWAAAGVPVTFIGRPGFAADIAEHGLTLSDQSGWEAHLDSVDYRCDPDALAGADVIALCVKSGATADAAQQIAEHALPGTPVISFQNGISNLELLETVLRPHFPIVRGLVPFNIAYLAAGRFHKGVAGELWAEDRPETQRLAAQVTGSRGVLRLSDDMLGLAWGKLLINLNNAVNALSGRTLVEELKQRDYRRVVAASQREGLGLLRRAGITPGKIGPIPPRLLPLVLGAPDWLFNRLFLKSWKIDAKARSSMADDLAQGRKTEIDHLNGELVRLAERHGARAPVNRKIVDLVRKAEAGAAPLRPKELRREVLGR